MARRVENPDQFSFDFDDWAAERPQPQESPPQEAPLSPRFALAERLAEILEAGDDLSARRLSAEATDVFGGTQAEGAWLGKDAYDAMEVAVNLHLLRSEAADWGALDAEGAAAKVRDLTALVQRLPTQTRRD